MTIDLKTSTANALLDAWAALFPAGSLLQGRTGSPAGADNAAGGSLLVEITLPATPFNAAASKAVTKNGTWSATATGTGTMGHARLKNAGDTHRDEMTVTATGGGGDMTIDNTSVASGQTVSCATFTRTL